MKGYKVFNSDWTCRGFQYKIGETYEMNEKPCACKRGFHFCSTMAECFNYYAFDPQNKVAEVDAIGDLDTDDNLKYCTNKIAIVRELSWEEVLRICNSGIGNSGLSNSGNRNSGNRNSGNRNSGNCNSGNRNSGNRNSGDCNSGDWNSGDCNSGNRNSGDCNSGDCNSGDWNSGDCNSGNRNSGNRNSGNRNSGDCNSGDWNSGDCNSGDWNSGDCNSGNRNSGDCNSGNRNSGDCNSGNRNSGDYNSGDCNSGDWNLGFNNVGVFNTDTKKITMFDVKTDMTIEDWRNSDARYIMLGCPFSSSVFVWKENMTEEEKEVHSEYKTIGGYIKTVKATTDDKQKWWDGLCNTSKNVVMSLPNFNADKFCKCVGLRHI
ncbi:MAG: PPE family protein [Clostridium lundense]|nr:PPE family protein [Clostridium lundense]